MSSSTLEKRVSKLELTPAERPDLHALASILRNALSPDVLMEVSELLLEGRVVEALEIIKLNKVDSVRQILIRLEK